VNADAWRASVYLLIFLEGIWKTIKSSISLWDNIPHLSPPSLPPSSASRKPPHPIRLQISARCFLFYHAFVFKIYGCFHLFYCNYYSETEIHLISKLKKTNNRSDEISASEHNSILICKLKKYIIGSDEIAARERNSKKRTISRF